MTQFELWVSNTARYCEPTSWKDCEAAYLAGQASADEVRIQVCEEMQQKINTLIQQNAASFISFTKQVAELERERDEYANALRLRMMQITELKAQAGEPECPYPCGWKNLFSIIVESGAFLARSLTEDEPITEHQRNEVMRMIGFARELTLHGMKTHPTTEPISKYHALAVQVDPALKPATMPSYGQIQWKDLIDAIGEAQGVAWEPDESYYIGHQPVSINMNSLNRIVSKFTHPTTERPYNPLNDYAVIPMNPTTERRVIPDGWKLVPIEPTEEMLKRAEGKGYSITCGRVIYKAMLNAAPSKGE